MTEITITLGNRPDLDPEERRLRALRAQEILMGAAWAFNEVTSDLTEDLINTDPHDDDKRESLYHQINALGAVKGHLVRIVNNQAAEENKNERKHRNAPPANHE
jgi:hypothetical protein